MSATSVEIVEARPALGGLLRRVVGSVDFRGQGTEFPIRTLGPFVLVDDVRGIDGPGQPPFGMHPHAGLVAISYCAAGGSWIALSNVPGAEEHTIAAHDVVIANAGRGLVHDEHTQASGHHEMTQIILRLPSELRDRAASVTKHQTEEIATGIRRIFGDALLTEFKLRAAAYHCQVRAGEVVEVPIAEGHNRAFVYARSGDLRLAGHGIAEGQIAIARDATDFLEMSSPNGGECLIGTGAVIDGPWVKLLGNNGFVVAGSEEEALARMEQFERERQNFGHSSD